MTLTAPAAPEIAVVIVNYGIAELAIRAVESVLEFTSVNREFEIHLVDNASPENDAQLLIDAHKARKWGSRVVLHLEAENHGFGRGNNLVLRSLKGRKNPPEKVYFLNPDACLINDAVGILSDKMDANPKAGIIGTALVPDGDKRTVSYAFRYPTPMSEFADTLNVGPISGLFRRWSVAMPPDIPSGPVGWVSGATFMARFEALEEVNFFDPAFFLYYEEMDLMRRLTKAGWLILTETSAKVAHISGASTDMKQTMTKARRMPEYWFDSWRIYFSKHYGRIGALGFAISRLIGSLGNSLIWRIFNPARMGSRNFGRDFTKNVIGPLIAGRPNG